MIGPKCNWRLGESLTEYIFDRADNWLNLTICLAVTQFYEMIRNTHTNIQLCKASSKLRHIVHHHIQWFTSPQNYLIHKKLRSSPAVQRGHCFCFDSFKKEINKYKQVSTTITILKKWPTESMILPYKGAFSFSRNFNSSKNLGIGLSLQCTVHLTNMFDTSSNISGH